MNLRWSAREQGMKRLLATGLVFAALSLGSVGPVRAASQTPTATVTAATVDSLNVTNSGGMTLDLLGGAGSNTLGPASDTTAVLNYTHNASTTKSISAQVTNLALTGGAANPNDISLTVSVASGSGTVTLFSANTASAATTVYPATAKGAISGKTV